MVTTVVLAILGMVPVVIDRGVEPITRLEYHPMVGLGTLVIVIVQPFIAAFRPGKVGIPSVRPRYSQHLQDHPWRPIFYAVHSSLGYAGIVLALAAVYLTQTLPLQDQVM